MNATSLGLPSSWRRELQVLVGMTGVFLVAYFLPRSNAAVLAAIHESLKLLHWYVRNHTLACLGVPIGIGRAVGAIMFSIAIGWIMATVFRREESARVREALAKAGIAGIREAGTSVIWIHHRTWWFAGALGLAVLRMAWRGLDREEVGDWMSNTWDFPKQIVPLLFGGVLVVGFVGALIPEAAVARLIGDNSVSANLVASVIGAFRYFATLTGRAFGALL